MNPSASEDSYSRVVVIDLTQTDDEASTTDELFSESSTSSLEEILQIIKDEPFELPPPFLASPPPIFKEE